MKKLKVFVAFGALCFLMSSCVYSLFPIYTKESIVYLPELIGRWQTGDNPNEFVEFYNGISIDASIKVKDGNSGAPAESGSSLKIDWTIDFDDDEYLVIDGDTIRDREFIKNYWVTKLDSMEAEWESELMNSANKLGEAVGKLGETLNKMTDVSPMYYSSSDETYIMKVYDEGVATEYEATVTKIGDDLFLDLYASDNQMSEMNLESRVWFPVHTFMKIDLQGGNLKLTEFDLQKMNKLFESNLVRIRHEEVDGTVLITASTEELRKFLDRYSDDESVFEDTRVYKKVL